MQRNSLRALRLPRPAAPRGERARVILALAAHAPAAVVLVSLLGACRQVGESSIDLLAPPAPGEEISFRADVQPILSARCAIPGCHQGAGPDPLPQVCPPEIPPANFEEGQAYANLVGQTACESALNAGSPDKILNRVERFDLARSYLYLKITDCPNPDTGCFEARMPFGLSPLGEAEVATIQQWIEEGAQDN